MKFLRTFLTDETAATAVEYAVMLALLLLAMLTMIAALGTENGDTWKNNSDKISSALAS